MYVVTADQRASTRHGVRVDELLAGLDAWVAAWPGAIPLPPERTVGDEIQAVTTDPEAALDLVLALMRRREWSVGVGVGPVDEPLGASARASSGEAFVLARRAVERARGRSEPVPLVVAARDEAAQESATAMLQLLGSVVRRRSHAGWEVHDLLREVSTQREAADRLGISEQAVSLRVASAMLEEERRARPVAVDLLRVAEDERGAS